MPRPPKGTPQRTDPDSDRGTGRRIDLAEEERLRARYWLPYHERQFNETENPVYAWAAFLDARAAGVEVPPSVMEYLERCARRVHTLATWGKETESVEVKTENGGTVIHQHARIPAKGIIAPAIAEAFEFVKAGRNGPTNSLRVLVDAAHETSIACEVYFRLRQGEQLKYACEHVAAEHPAACDHDPKCDTLSARQVGRYWRAHGKEFPPIAKDK